MRGKPHPRSGLVLDRMGMDVLLSLIYLKYDDVDISELVLNTKQYLYDDFRSKHDLFILSMHLIVLDD